MAFVDSNDPNMVAAGDLVGATSRARVAGSGFTYLHWDNKLIGFIESLSHTSGRPVAPATPIHPMDSPYAVEIVTPQAMGPGTITAGLFELYGQRVWDRLSQMTGAVDIVDIFQRVANSAHPITMVKYVAPPTIRGKKMLPYTEEYHNCVISDIADGETVSVETLQVVKEVTFMYTHITRGGRNPNAPGSKAGSGWRDSTTTVFN